MKIIIKKIILENLWKKKFKNDTIFHKGKRVKKLFLNIIFRYFKEKEVFIMEKFEKLKNNDLNSKNKVEKVRIIKS